MTQQEHPANKEFIDAAYDQGGEPYLRADGSLKWIQLPDGYYWPDGKLVEDSPKSPTLQQKEKKAMSTGSVGTVVGGKGKSTKLGKGNPVDQWITRAIPVIRASIIAAGGRQAENMTKYGYKGIHARYSGFNEAFKVVFPDKDVRQETERMAKEGKLETWWAKGGVILCLPGESNRQVVKRQAGEPTARERMVAGLVQAIK